jgi:hypothetical protein
LDSSRPPQTSSRREWGSSLPPSTTTDSFEDILHRLAEMPPTPRVLELVARVRNARDLGQLGLLSPLERTTLAVDLDLAAMRLTRELDADGR